MKQYIDLAMFFLEHGGSFSLISKHLPKNKEVVMVAVKNLKDHEDIFNLAFQQNEKILR